MIEAPGKLHFRPYRADDRKTCLAIFDASHKSAPFFRRFGAKEHRFARNGWGPGMHRVDMELEICRAG